MSTGYVSKNSLKGCEKRVPAPLINIKIILCRELSNRTFRSFLFFVVCRCMRNRLSRYIFYDNVRSPTSALRPRFFRPTKRRMSKWMCTELWEETKTEFLQENEQMSSSCLQWMGKHKRIGKRLHIMQHLAVGISILWIIMVCTS